MNLALLAARFRLGQLRSEELSSVGAHLLDRGIDTPAVHSLATMHAPTLAEAHELLEQALEDAGVDVPGEREAHWALLNDALERIVRREIDPAEGAYDVWWQVCQLGEAASGSADWHQFVALASKYEDHPRQRDKIGLQIVVAARRRLAASGRRPVTVG
ncbi:MAG TPA: hypothetical protein VFK13_10335 [Gemmatimonadaceae bacterium]|nr:hypothetical protein [Gemmatimonadaceae bacterium]